MTTGDTNILSTAPIRSASCVIPAWNASGTIDRALCSALNTPGVDEIVVVDDGSSDNTAACVKAIAVTATTPVRVIQQANAGAAAARNTGLRSVSLDWVTFLDADDEMLPEAITSKAAYLVKCPNPNAIDAVHGSFVRSDTGTIGRFAETRERVNPDGIGLPDGIPGGVVSYLFRTEALKAIGGFRDELVMFEDFELILRLISSGARIVGCCEPGFYRHYTAGSLSRGIALQKRLRIERQFLSIAAQDRLMSRSAIMRRLARNRLRQLFHTATGR